MLNITGAIRVATNNDTELIHQWLLDHKARGVSDTFLCHWNLTKQVHDQGSLNVFISDVDKKPAAYIWKDFGILEVREDMRGKGIGRKLVEYGFKETLNSDLAVIAIECAPTTSIPFWKHMGFTLYTETKAFIVIHKDLPLPMEGEKTSVNICFYPECKKWKPETKPVESFSPSAVRSSSGVIYLSSRVSIFTGKSEWNFNPVIEININGLDFFLGKANSREAGELGVKKGHYSYYIEQLTV